MELAIAIPLGLLFTGAVEKHKRVLYSFAAMLMGVALLMTNSRGGVISLGADALGRRHHRRRAGSMVHLDSVPPGLCAPRDSRSFSARRHHRSVGRMLCGPRSQLL